MDLVLIFHHHSKIMQKLYLSLILITIISSCDIVESPYMDNPGTTNPIDTTTYIQKILIEDFTGHTCPNCPSAAEELDAMQELFGDQIIGIALHVGTSFARPLANQAPKFQYDFRTKWGEEIDVFFDVTNNGLPKGLVNRIDYPNDHRKNKDEWLDAVQELLNASPKFGINILVSGSEDAFNIDITSKALEDLNGSYNLIVCLTEDSIINWQKDGAFDVEEYEHKHVLRACLNDTWGDPLKLNETSYTDGEEITKNYSINIAALEQYNEDYSANNLAMGNGNAGNWNSEKMNIVAYIYNTDTYEIVQVEYSHLY